MVRIIAFYLPQFHPIPENDEWWGKDFTEWTNVKKARPLFRRHYQPRVPVGLDYYDLRDPEVRERQAEMARYAGIEGFAYWHYWFAGKRLLEKPFNEVLLSGKPSLPFCLAWANASWTGIWHGAPDRILIEQTYPGVEDHIKHFYTNLKAFKDERYINVDNKPLFYIYQPFTIPDEQYFIDCWQKLAVENGLKGIYFIASVHKAEDVERAFQMGYNAVNYYTNKDAILKKYPLKYIWHSFSMKYLEGLLNSPVFNFSKIAKSLFVDICKKENVFPIILSGFDNSPRSGKRGLILNNFTPELFKIHVKDILENTLHKKNNIIFLRSWNEWAEGNYVEPDMKFGWGFLDVLHEYLVKYNSNTTG